MKIKRSELIQIANKYIGNDSLEAQNQIMLKIATAMCARVSYTTIDDNKEANIERMLKLHDKLIQERHDSPLEHCAKCLTTEEYFLYSKGKDGSREHEHGWVDNFRGFQSYRNMIKFGIY